MADDPSANGHDLEAMVHRAVAREMEVRVGSVDVAVNQRCGPIEKYQVQILEQLRLLSDEVAGLRQDQVNLRGELRRHRLVREQKRARKTQ